MRRFIHYHDVDTSKHLPNELPQALPESLSALDTSGLSRHTISVGTSMLGPAERSIGQLVYLIVGVTEHTEKHYYLWSVSVPERIEQRLHGSIEMFCDGQDTQHIFNPPILLDGREGFSAFAEWTADFRRGFSEITHNVFAATLDALMHERGIALDVDDSEDLLYELFEDTDAEKLKEQLALLDRLPPMPRRVQRSVVDRGDSSIVRRLKLAANYSCQFPGCAAQITTREGYDYVEVAHITPVSEDGKSIPGNLLVLCPNHHKEFDLGRLEIKNRSLTQIDGTLNGRPFEIKLLPYDLQSLLSPRTDHRS